MGRFEEQLLDRLVQQHGATLAQARRPAPSAVRRVVTSRPVWIGSGTLGLAASIVVATALSAGAPAFAVSQGADGSVTVSIRDIGAVDAANAELRKLGAPVAAVPMTADCRDTVTLENALPQGGGVDFSTRGSVSSTGDGEGEVTVLVDGVPEGTTLLLAAKKDAGMLTLAIAGSVQGRVPNCLPEPPPAPGAPATGVPGTDGGQPTAGSQQDS
ncbi:hypothetical protein EDD27_9314 [Nonomuraea polychroma]|uniref:Uncharacterized protein n=1 Tax=Nonomuraea polychroma TaxID=46176 RepID=A0A438ML09_9ACTN|nr:hypothetical protein [Nonomuraea polychroma]RVX46432.1 hypothetical protein EDD27_9314 [Nonomuraea polychroma]